MSANASPACWPPELISPYTSTDLCLQKPLKNQLCFVVGWVQEQCMLHVMSSCRNGAPLPDALAIVRARVYPELTPPRLHHQLDQVRPYLDTTLRLTRLSRLLFERHGFLRWRRSRAEGHQAQSVRYCISHCAKPTCPLDPPYLAQSQLILSCSPERGSFPLDHDGTACPSTTLPAVTGDSARGTPYFSD